VKGVLDAATAITARRPAALLACSTLSLAPVAVATWGFADQVLAPERPSLFGLLGVGVLSAMAWLAFCWGQAAGVRICRATLDDSALALSEAIRRGLEDVPRVMVAAATRALLLVLAAVPLGALLPHAAAWTAGLVPSAVLDGTGPREGLARARRAGRAHAAAQALPWLLWPVVWLNLVLAYTALLGWLVRIDPGHLESALRDGPALGVLAAVAWWLVDPVRAAASVAAHGAWRQESQGHDLVRLAQRALSILLIAGCWARPVAAEPLAPEAWSAYLWEAREAVLAGAPGASDQVLTLLGREVQVAPDRVVMVTDPTLAELSARLAAGDPGAVVDAVHHLVVLERLGKILERSGSLPDTWPAVAPVTRSSGPAPGAELRASLDTLGASAGRLRSWAVGSEAGDPVGPAMVWSGFVAVTCGLGWLVWVGRRLEAVSIGQPGLADPASVPLPEALQGTARAAVRQGFLETLRALERSGRVDEVSRLTNGQVAARLDGSLWERFIRACDAYEGTWYGGQAAGEPELLAVEEALAAARGRET